jgi:hypothetical protein
MDPGSQSQILINLTIINGLWIQDLNLRFSFDYHDLGYSDYHDLGYSD